MPAVVLGGVRDSSGEFVEARLCSLNGAAEQSSSVPLSSRNLSPGLNGHFLQALTSPSEVREIAGADLDVLGTVAVSTDSSVGITGVSTSGDRTWAIAADSSRGWYQILGWDPSSKRYVAGAESMADVGSFSAYEVGQDLVAMPDSTHQVVHIYRRKGVTLVATSDAQIESLAALSIASNDKFAIGASFVTGCFSLEMGTGTVTRIPVASLDSSNNVQSVLLVRATTGYAVFVAHAGGVTTFTVDDEGNLISTDTLLDFARPASGSLLRIVGWAIAE
jgi:hypothetical protein